MKNKMMLVAVMLSLLTVVSAKAQADAGDVWVTCKGADGLVVQVTEVKMPFVMIRVNDPSVAPVNASREVFGSDELAYQSDSLTLTIHNADKSPFGESLKGELSLGWAKDDVSVNVTCTGADLAEIQK